MEDDWLDACAAWNSDYLHASHTSNDTVDMFTDSDSSGGDGDDCSTANLSCAMNFAETPAIYDSTSNISYVVDISNRFFSLSIKQVSMAEFDVEIFAL